MRNYKDCFGSRLVVEGGSVMARITVRFSEEEYAKIKGVSQAKETSIAEFVRNELFRREQDFAEALSREQRLENIEQYLREQNKNIEMTVNLMYQFMRADLGEVQAKEIGDKVKRILQEA